MEEYAFLIFCTVILIDGQPEQALIDTPPDVWEEQGTQVFNLEHLRQLLVITGLLLVAFHDRPPDVRVASASRLRLAS